jgi:hypothetical protein
LYARWEHYRKVLLAKEIDQLRRILTEIERQPNSQARKRLTGSGISEPPPEAGAARAAPGLLRRDCPPRRRRAAAGCRGC